MSKHNDIYNILGKLNSLQPKEESKPNILKEFAEPKSVDVVQNLNNKFKEHKQLNEYFHFDMPKGKDRGPRDTGTDELDRRSKLGKDPLIKHGKEYKEKDKHGGYNIAGPKGNLPEGDMEPNTDSKAKYNEPHTWPKGARPGKYNTDTKQVSHWDRRTDSEREQSWNTMIEDEVEESGLQAYLGKKKYGKEGMQALQKAGRDGASKEKMAMIRAKHDKMDEAVGQEGPADLLAAIEQEIARPGRSTDNLRDVLNATFGSDRSPEFKKARAVIGKYLDLVDNAAMGSEQDGIAPMRSGNIARHIQQYDLTDYLQHAAAMLDKHDKMDEAVGQEGPADLLAAVEQEINNPGRTVDNLTDVLNATFGSDRSPEFKKARAVIGKYLDLVDNAAMGSEQDGIAPMRGGDIARHIRDYDLTDYLQHAAAMLDKHNKMDETQVDEISQGLAANYMDAAEKDISARKKVDTRDPKISKRRVGKFHAVLRKTGTVPTTDNPTHGKFITSEAAMDEDMLAKKDYDGDGEVESGKDEYMGSRDKAIKKSIGKDSTKKDAVDEGFEDQHDVENKGEYDQEGDMAKDDLSTIEDAANELDSILSADDNLPEWVQSKINKAMDYLDTARDYMKANSRDDNPEMNEGEYQDKVNKSKVPAFQRKAKGGDWKVSTKDLDDEASKSPTGRAGLEKAKERLRQQGVMEGFPTVADAKARAEKEKGTGKFDKQTTSTGTRYTRKPETYADDGEETSGSSDTPKKRGRPKKNTGPERVTSKAWKHKGGRKTNESIKLDTFVEDTISELDALLLSEKAVSKAQQKFMGMVYAAKKGDKPASKEVAKAAKGMSKSDAKDFAKTKHKGLPSKVTEGINFMEMMRETDQTVEEMLNELHAELDEYKTSGRMGDKLRDALDLHRHSKNRLMGETQDERKDFFHNPNVPDDEQLPAPPQEVDVELNELARLAGLGEVSRGEYIKQQDSAAEHSGKDKFNAFGQTFDTDQVHEATCNMTAEGQMCPEHGFAECGGMYESAKPDFLDMDKDGDKKEPMKKALKDKDTEKQKVDECGDMSPMSNMSQSQSGMNVNTSFDTKTGRKTMSVTADGEAAEQLAQMLKMAGMGSGHSHNGPEKRVVMITPEQEVAEDFANEPNEQYADTESIISAGQDLNRKKQQYADKPKAGDNPMATENVQLEDRLAALYDSIKVKTR